MLDDRFGAASAHPPLAGLSDAAARELAREMAQASELEDLPGKWQAALLESEAAAAGAGPRAHSCCGGSRPVDARAAA